MVNEGFDNAQKLYSLYSILDDEKELENKLTGIMGLSYHYPKDNIQTRGVINDIIMKYYPNEAVIKAKFIDQILMKSTRQIIIFEMNVNKSRTDLCKINGHSTVYEIKTDLDSVVRLERQLEDYAAVFEEIYLICSQKRYQQLIEKLPSHVGVYVYTIKRSGNIKFVMKKKAHSHVELNAEQQLESLTYSELLKTYPVQESSDKGTLIQSILHLYSNKTINMKFKACLKKRYSQRWNFLCTHKSAIFQIDYQWFYNNPIEPQLIYNR
jgi:hypothetical protein